MRDVFLLFLAFVVTFWCAWFFFNHAPKWLSESRITTQMIVACAVIILVACCGIYTAWQWRKDGM